MNPTSSPVITIPRIMVAQFVSAKSLKLGCPFDETRNMTKEKTDATA